MHTTPISLLQRLRQPAAPVAWNRFVELYTPLLYFWARRLGLGQDNASDLVQDVFVVLVQKLPEFHYDREKSFRSWLRTVLLNKWRAGQRRNGQSPHSHRLPDEVPSPDDCNGFDETEYRQLITQRALELMQREFQENTWKACWALLVEGRPAKEVASELGMSEGAVYVAKSRVLRRLREELAGLLD